MKQQQNIFDRNDCPNENQYSNFKFNTRRKKQQAKTELTKIQ
jgi:hypothetical protein